MQRTAVNSAVNGAAEAAGPAAHQLDQLRRQLTGRRFIVALEVVVGSVQAAEDLHKLGVSEVLAIGGSRGTGPLDPEVAAEAVDLGLPPVSGGIMPGIRAFEAAIGEPPQSVLDRVEAFDPEGEAYVLGNLFTQHERIFDRPVYGARPAAWRALEDKTRIDALWDEAGVRRAPREIVAADRRALQGAAARLDRGEGTVWVADNREGWHGGSDYLRWVRGQEDLADATAFMAACADRVRVMPFLEGVPCSIHGWVIGDEVIAFRPVEMVVLRDLARSRLRYAGTATAWFPRADAVEEMRAVARRVGSHLRDTVGYRGVFTVDGVLGTDGFLPTELNPRFGAGINALSRGTDLPLFELHAATIEWPHLDWRPAELERAILAAAEEGLAAAGFLVLDGEPGDQREVAVRVVDGEVIESVDPGQADGSLLYGPGPSGSLLRVRFTAPEKGRLVAPLVASAFALAAERFNLDLPTFTAAADAS